MDVDEGNLSIFLIKFQVLEALNMVTNHLDHESYKGVMFRKISGMHWASSRVVGEPNSSWHLGLHQMRMLGIISG